MRSYDKGINQDIIQEMNRSLLIRLLRREGNCSRVHLAHLTNLKQATVTNIVNDFISWELVRETGFLSGNKGRRSIGIEVNTERYRVIGVRLARKYFSVGTFDLTGKPHYQVRRKIAKEDAPEEIFERILNEIEKMLAKEQDKDVLVIGVSLPGPFIKKEGRIALMTEVAGWSNIQIESRLEQTFHLPIVMEQDANAAVLAQLWHNKEVDQADMVVYVAAGQGIGAGILVDGELLRGTMGMAGEIGHTSIEHEGIVCACGNRGCLEQYCSSIALTRAINQRRIGEPPLEFEEICDRIAKGDELCREEYRKAGHYLGVGIVNLINSLNPSTIILGDEMSHVDSAILYDVVHEVVKERVLPQVYDNLKIVISNTPKDSCFHGAAIVAIEEIFSHPAKYIMKTT